MNLDDLQARQLELSEQSQAILEKLEGEKREPTDDERSDLDGILASMEVNGEDIARMTKLHALRGGLEMSNGRKSAPEPVRQPIVEDDEVDPAPTRMAGKPKQTAGDGIRTPLGQSNRGGFRSFGEFAQTVKMACAPGHAFVDGRLARMAPTTYGIEGVGTDGGFAVPPDFRSEIMQKVLGEDSLLRLTDQFSTSSNSITFPKDETTPWQTTGGVQCAWEGEASQISESKPALQNETIKLNKLAALVPVSEELMEDAPALDRYLRQKVIDKMIFKVNYGIVQGTGVGMPLGITNSASVVTVSKEGSQAADTLLPANVLKMYSRMYAPLASRAVWLCHQDCLPQIWGLANVVKNVAGTENVGGSGVNFMGSTGLRDAPFGTMLGRPIIPTQACETIGDLNDLLFVDLGSYMTATKTAGPKQDVSMHLYFDYDMLAYRFIWRMAGKPWWSSYIAPRDGSNNMSWAVNLEAR